MIFFPTFLLGMFICWLIWRRDEKLFREREQMESELEDSRRMLAAHLEHFECRLKVEEEWPEVVG